MDTYSGDPKMYLTEDGADISISGGSNQPVMETGRANVALISLFTGRGWCGNAFIREKKNKINSGYVTALKNPLTVKALAVIRDEADKALSNAGLLVTDIEVYNPQGHQVNVVAKIKDSTGQEQTLITVYGRNGPTGVTWGGAEVTWGGATPIW
jgi:hypothetical protein